MTLKTMHVWVKVVYLNLLLEVDSKLVTAIKTFVNYE